MLHPHQLHDYQKKAVNFQCTLPHSALFLDVGLGKTVVTLTSIAHLMSHQLLKAVVIVAPVRVCKLVWRQEALKWSHTQHLKFAMLTGNKDQRSRALLQPADIYLINYENLGWFAQAVQTYFKGRPLPVDGIVFDELDHMKNSTTQRVRSLKEILPLIKWKSGLTGTPASNGYKDLHGQFLVLDGGVRLGDSKTKFMTQFYRKIPNTYKEMPYKDTESSIKQLISDITLNMSAEDYLKMPDFIVNDVSVELPEKHRLMYDQLEAELFMVLDSGTEIELFNKGSLTNKCLQFSAGAVYPIAGLPAWEPLHDVKMDALEDIISESNGQPILCFYGFRFEAERLMERFKELRPINLTACKSEKDLSNAMDRWQKGDCQLMISHPKSAAYGIDGLQKNGHIMVWSSLTWSLSQYIQAIGRLQRQGQGVPVICHRIIMKDTLDQAQVIALHDKADTQNSLRKAIQDYRQMRKW
jgi:SNF2 family DNA or RNA helicase